jgi:hypothetical protein
MKDRILVGVPTRRRPEYLSGLLATLMYQTESKWDLLIVDTDPEPGLEEHPQVKRFIDTLRALDHRVTVARRPNPGSKSPVIAVNTLLVESALQGYGYLFKVDDDHTAPPETLARMREEVDGLEGEGPVLVSAPSPWMHKAWEGAVGPEDIRMIGQDETTPSDIRLEKNGEVFIGDGLFFRWKKDKANESYLVESKLGSDAVFMMRPDLRILQSDVGPSSLYAGAVWFLQLRGLLGYKIYFDRSLDVWHVAAPSGGVRREEGLYVKTEEVDYRRKDVLKMLLRQFDLEESWDKE